MTTVLAPDVTALAAALEEHLRALGSALVAYSGGVDSSVVAVAAHRALGSDALVVTADTESNTADDLAVCRDIAARFDLRHEVIRYSELAIPNYAQNPVNRCYFCKSALYERLNALAIERSLAAVCDGSNADDAGDYRPGLKAVAENRVRSPLRELAIGKEAVRALARHYGLPNHDRPASPCLSSRIPYGQKVTREKLDQVGAAEAFLRSLGLFELRCRHHGDVARIEVPPAAMGTVLAHREAIVAHFRALGFHWVSLDLAGFQSGGLNRVLAPAKD
jgi:uncharacterized protein